MRVCVVDADPAALFYDRSSAKAPVARLRAQLAGLEGAPAGAPPMQTRTFSQQRAALFARPHLTRMKRLKASQPAPQITLASREPQAS